MFEEEKYYFISWYLSTKVELLYKIMFSKLNHWLQFKKFTFHSKIPSMGRYEESNYFPMVRKVTTFLLLKGEWISRLSPQNRDKKSKIFDKIYEYQCLYFWSTQIYMYYILCFMLRNTSFLNSMEKNSQRVFKGTVSH